MELCIICGRPSDAVHHWLFGYGIRQLAESDNIKSPVCNRCHNMGAKIERIHDNSMAEKLSKMYGQLLYEKNAIVNGATEDQAREMFMKRYGINYL